MPARAALAAVVALGLAAAGCGSGSHRAATPGGGGTTSTVATGGAATAAGWLGSSPPPASWPVARIPTGASMSYPPGWRRIHGDRGTASVALLGAGGRFRGYLNLTPRQGNETLSNWVSFRPDHNKDEGDRVVHRLAGATNLAFGDARGSCIRDAYTTKTRAHYIEIACLIVGAHGAAVVVGAVPPDDWAQQSGDIRRAIVGVRV